MKGRTVYITLSQNEAMINDKHGDNGLSYSQTNDLAGEISQKNQIFRGHECKLTC